MNQNAKGLIRVKGIRGGVESKGRDGRKDEEEGCVRAPEPTKSFYETPRFRLVSDSRTTHIIQRRRNSKTLQAHTCRGNLLTFSPFQFRARTNNNNTRT